MPTLYPCFLAVHVSPSPVPFFLYTYPYYASKEDWLQDDITQILEIKLVVFFFVGITSWTC